MRPRYLAGFTALFGLLFTISMAAFAQLPPAAEVLPAGFQLLGERNLGGSMFIDAKKPNENFPKPHMDQGIKLEIAWTNQPMAAMVLEMAAKQPEDPAGRSPGSATREEPCGRQRYREGVLSCRKVIIPWIGGGSGPDLVTWRIGWTGIGPTSTGMVGININNFHGSKETAMGWIDTIIPKITKRK
jgi:hypothetical protein